MAEIQNNKSEWINIPDSFRQYHERQIKKPYRSTEVFVEWLMEKGVFKPFTKVCDLAAGGGANLIYMASKNPDISFEGIDLNPELVKYGNNVLKEYGVENQCKMLNGDWYHLDERLKDRYQGVVSFQTLFSLPEYENAIKCIAELNPDWIAFSSLFYDGDIDYTILLKDYVDVAEGKEYTTCYYNISSIPRVRKLLYNLGYTAFEYTPFNIDIDLEQTVKNGLGTYTKKLENGERIQISGGLMMPWYFILAKK